MLQDHEVLLAQYTSMPQERFPGQRCLAMKSFRSKAVP